MTFIPNPAHSGQLPPPGRHQRSHTARIWNSLPPLAGINHLGVTKPTAKIFGETEADTAQPIMVGMDIGSGRSLAFAGETWHWYRSLVFEEGRTVHRKFWRQVIFWLTHKEDQGQNEVKLALDSRRIAVGQKLDLTVTARDEKGSPLTDLSYETRVEAEEKDKDGHAFSTPISVLNRGEDTGLLHRAAGPAGGVQGHGGREAQRTRGRPRQRTVPDLHRRPRDGKSGCRPHPVAPDRHPVGRRESRPGAARPLHPGTERPDLHRNLDPDREEDLGQLAFPAPLYRYPCGRVVDASVTAGSEPSRYVRQSHRPSRPPP